MGKRRFEELGGEPMSMPKAIAAALQAVLPERGWLPISKKIGMSNSTLRRLANERLERINAAHVVKLRKIAGFSAEYDKLIGDQSPDAEAMDMARRVLRAFPTGGGELVIEAIEDLAPHLDPAALADLLRAQKIALRRQRPSVPTAADLPKSAKKLPSGS